jgi:hypothetical protein
MIDPRIVVLIFVSGKIVITGAKSRSAILDGLEKLWPLIFSHRKTAERPSGRYVKPKGDGALGEEEQDAFSGALVGGAA